jgi:hypothetical protein
MAFFDDMAAELEAYPETYVELEIVNVNFTGSALNEEEQATFNVRVTNNGPLRLDNVTVRVKGLNGALVKNSNALAQFESEFVSASTIDRINANGGSAVFPGVLSLKAPANPQPSQNLIRVTLEDWDANLDSIMLNRSEPTNSVKGTFAAEVVAQ